MHKNKCKTCRYAARCIEASRELHCRDYKQKDFNRETNHAGRSKGEGMDILRTYSS